MRRTTPECDHLDPTVLLLRRALLGAAAPLLVALTGCGEEPFPSYGQRPHCVGDAWVPTSNLSLPQQVAYASLRRSSRAGVHIDSESGVPCEGATDARLCEAEIDRVSIREVEPGASFLLTTDRDMIEAFQTLEEKLALLGAIDTPDEALLIAQHAGYRVHCGVEVGRDGAGYGMVFANDGGCGATSRTQVLVTEDGWLHVGKQRETDADDGCAVGRRPPGLLRARALAAARSGLGRYFARAARLEAASVDAFAILERELAQHGLPRALREALRDSADDEVRHARDTAALAERFGARPAAATLARTPPRTLAEIAADNAVEGCALETYSAYLAVVQASVARDPELARVLTAIARDETRHAALSWQLAAWMEPQLDTGTRRRVADARRRALGGLGAMPFS